MSAAGGVRLAVGTLSILPVGALTGVDRRAWRQALLLAPLLGAVLGAIAWAVAAAVSASGGSTDLAAVVVVASLALLTGGLHLDGLADVADGLGSRRAAVEARAVMRRSDVGPFGVLALVLTVLLQVAALSPLMGEPSSASAVVGASLLSRTAITCSCRTGVLAADSSGLGASAAGVVPRVAAMAVVTLAVAVVVAAGAWIAGARGALAGGGAAVLALVAAEAWRRHCTRRLGGLTGDVLGATEQVAWTTFVVAFSLALP